MSTYWHFECLNHDPPLSSRDEFTQHTDDEAFRRGVKQAQSRPLHPDGPIVVAGSDDYFDWNAWRFLVHHPTCEIGLVNEYDQHRPLPPAQKGTP